MSSEDAAISILAPEKNCWRVEQAHRAAVIVDAAAYYRYAREAMLSARKQILLIGWDFDTRIRLDQRANDCAPAHLGRFISWLARRRPQLRIYILKWDLGALKLLGRGSTILHLLGWMRQRGISFRLDGAHPSGASHHQKILVIDDAFAFCGGIDMTGARWDTREHRDDNPLRKRPTTRRAYGPWHDATMAVDGDVAKALGDHARARWKAACGESIDPPETCPSAWPEKLEPTFWNVPVGISRTCGATGDQMPIREVEQLFLDMLGAARRFLYVETQYFASRAIAEAIARRLHERDCPEVVIVNPDTADGWLEERVMGPARAQLIRQLRARDEQGRFRIYTPVTKGGADIYVHAKIMIVDDLILRVGSANLNNRSMGLDSECDLTIDARLCGGSDTVRLISDVKNDLLAEHLGCDTSAVATCLDRTGSLIATIEQLRGTGRSLRPFDPPEFSDVENEIAESELLDPESADAQFEPFARPGLLSRLRSARYRRQH